jgi:tetratricopeptide (TPR) repeat protein
LAVLLGFAGFLLDWWGWGWAIFFSLIFFVVSWILVQRRFGSRLQPAWAAVQRQMQARQWDLAMQSLQDMLPIGKWMPLLRGQLLAVMGQLAYQSGKKDRAMELLEGASVRAADARLLLACIHFKNGDHKRAFEILQLAAAVNKKHALLHNTYAWMLHKVERSDEAQALLAKFLKRDANNAPTKDNMLRLQNRTRMSMQAFDMQWYALGLEQPPQSMGQVRRAPKGFREPPKQRGG